MSSNSGETATPLFRVISQVEQTQIGPAGVLTKGMMVVFTTAAGVQGSVFVPDAQYTVAAVRDAIAQKAAILDAVAGVGNGV